MLEGTAIHHWMGLLPRCQRAALCSHLSSPTSLLWQAAQGRAFKLAPPEKKKSGSAFTHFEKHAFELEREKYPAAAGNVLAAHNSINEKCGANQASRLEIEPRTEGCLSVQISV